MFGVLLCTHGIAGVELLKSVEMIIGKQSNVASVRFSEGQTMESLSAALQEAAQGLDLGDGLLICVDLFGGSPFNESVKIVGKFSGTEVITGVNIPMLLTLFLERNILSLTEIKPKLITEGQAGIQFFEDTPDEENREMAEDELD